MVEEGVFNPPRHYPPLCGSPKYPKYWTAYFSSSVNSPPPATVQAQIRHKNVRPAMTTLLNRSVDSSLAFRNEWRTIVIGPTSERVRRCRAPVGLLCGRMRRRTPTFSLLPKTRLKAPRNVRLGRHHGCHTDSTNGRAI